MQGQGTPEGSGVLAVDEEFTGRTVNEAKWDETMRYRVAAVQIGTVHDQVQERDGDRIITAMANREATLRKVEVYIRRAAEDGAEIIALPEGVFGRYNRGEGYGDKTGRREPEGRNRYVYYALGAEELPEMADENGPADKVRPDADRFPVAAKIAELSEELNVSIVLGVIERKKTRPQGAPHCTVLAFERGYMVHKHRKWVLTGHERVDWSPGDEDTVKPFELTLRNGQIISCAAIICWEMKMLEVWNKIFRPESGKPPELVFAVTADGRPIWQCYMKVLADMFNTAVVNVCQQLMAVDAYGPRENWHPMLEEEVGKAVSSDGQLMFGNSSIHMPMDDPSAPLAGPLAGQEGVVLATIDRRVLLQQAKVMDPSHYQKPGMTRTLSEKGEMEQARNTRRAQQADPSHSDVAAMATVGVMPAPSSSAVGGGAAEAQPPSAPGS